MPIKHFTEVQQNKLNDLNYEKQNLVERINYTKKNISTLNRKLKSNTVNIKERAAIKDQLKSERKFLQDYKQRLENINGRLNLIYNEAADKIDDNKLRGLLHNKSYTLDLLDKYENAIKQGTNNPDYSQEQLDENKEMLDFHKRCLMEIDETLDRYYEGETDVKTIEVEFKDQVVNKQIEQNAKKTNLQIFAPILNDSVWIEAEPVGKEIVDYGEDELPYDQQMDYVNGMLDHHTNILNKQTDPEAIAKTKEIIKRINADKEELISKMEKGKSEYNSVDEYMLQNELEYSKHKAAAKESIPDLGIEKYKNDLTLDSGRTELGKLVDLHMQQVNQAEKVFLQSPIYQRMLQQITKGMSKYGTPVKQEHYSIIGWHSHLQEELTDGLTYNEIMLAKYEDVVKTLQMGMRMETAEMKQHHLEHALELLTKVRK